LLLSGVIAAAVVILVAGILVRRAVSKHNVAAQAVAHQPTEQRITSNSPEAPVRAAAISPDGKYVAYYDPTGLYLREISSGEVRRWSVPKDFVAYPDSWFPDSTHLLVRRFEGAAHLSLWKLSLLGGSPQMLMDKRLSGRFPRMDRGSPSGTDQTSVPSFG
jgi:hypothetical protein